MSLTYSVDDITRYHLSNDRCPKDTNLKNRELAFPQSVTSILHRKRLIYKSYFNDNLSKFVKLKYNNHKKIKYNFYHKTFFKLILPDDAMWCAADMLLISGQ